MANSFKYLSDHDKTVTTNNLIEPISHSKRGITTTLPIGWVTLTSSPNYFKEFYDGNSSDLVALNFRSFDLTFGRSSVTTNGTSLDYNPEKNIYNQFSKVLLGYTTGSTGQKFDLNPEDAQGGSVLHNAYFINFSRNQFKDRIKQGSFNIKLNVGDTGADAGYYVHLVDSGSAAGGPVVRESRTGYVGYLYTSASSTAGQSANIAAATLDTVKGLIFYEAGIAVISPYLFSMYDAAIPAPSSSNVDIDQNILGIRNSATTAISGANSFEALVANHTINNLTDVLGKSLTNINYYSLTEINSAIYFCRAFNHEFNYSSNPTFLNKSEIVVKGGDPEEKTITYVTTVGLYGDDNQLLAVAKLSEPIRKSPDTELIVRVRLDY